MALPRRIDLCALAAGGLLMAAGADVVAGPAAVQGQWAGDRLQLVIDAEGGHVRSDCASGRFAGPVAATADGRFTAQGSFETHQPGAQRADLDAAAPAAASYSGELGNDGVLRLSITPTGASQAQVYNLQAGARIKLIRCL